MFFLFTNIIFEEIFIKFQKFTKFYIIGHNGLKIDYTKTLAIF